MQKLTEDIELKKIMQRMRSKRQVVEFFQINGTMLFNFKKVNISP